MCANPAMILGMQAAGAGMSALGAYGGAKSERSALAFQAQMLDINAQAAERRAQIALDQGAYQAAQVERAGADAKSTARAVFGARNVALDEGSALAVQSGIDLVSQEDAQQARVNAVRQAWGYRTEKTNMMNEAEAKRATRKGINPWTRATTSLIGSATSMAQSAYGMKGAGAFGG